MKKDSPVPSSSAARKSTGSLVPLKQAKKDFVRGYLVYLLWMVKGRTGEAASIAGWSVPNFCQLLRKYDLKAEDFKKARGL